MKSYQRFITEYFLKYNVVYQEEISCFNIIEIGSSKKDIDELIGKIGKWAYTEYQPIGPNSDEFKCYIWHLKYNFITCVFRNNKLISKKIKRRHRNGKL